MGQRGPDSSPYSCPPGRKFTPTRSGAQAAISWKLCSEGICASRPQSSQPVPNSSSVGGPEAPDDVAALSAANPKAMPGSSCAESAAIPVSQNVRPLLVLCTTERVSLLALRIVSHSSIRPYLPKYRCSTGTIRETRSQCQLDPNSIAADLRVQGFNAQRDQIPARYVDLCVDSFKR